jgi:oligoendopeptidase F
MRQRAHVLSPAEERLMAESSLLTGGPGTLFEVLNDLELPRPEFTSRSGETSRLTPVEFQRLRSGRDPQDRQRVFAEYFGAYAALRETFTQNVYSGVKTHLFRSRARGYPSSLAAALDGDNVPTSVYRNLIKQVRARLPVLHRYLKLRAHFLGLERMTYADLHCPLTDTPSREYDPAEARRLLLDGLAPLGQPYLAGIERAFAERWIDWRPAPGKRSGAYATGWAYDVHPYVLLNYVGDYESVSTLAHEMGHAMHSDYSNRRQPFATADYSIFVAEVASTLNETLLNQRLRAAASSEGERLALLTSYLDGIRGTLFRQTMFAEFELALHERVEAGDVLTGESVNRIYLGLLRDYHGHDVGVVEIDEAFAIEWAAIPHMYYDFYVYQYATGIVAATALAEALQCEPETARVRYLEFLSSGGSDYPLELLRRAGVDLESRVPYDDAFATIGRQLDALESMAAGYD